MTRFDNLYVEELIETANWDGYINDNRIEDYEFSICDIGQDIDE